MSRCLQLASQAIGNTSPNPMVGAVIVYNDKIIGEGFHKNYGESHAEVNAINSVKNKELLQKSSIYVSLEPCSHFGKTPPCADLIIDMQIPEIFIGSIDPNPRVAGKGIEKLKNAGLKVVTGILKDDCDDLNKRFFSYYNKERPYIILKWAQTIDGFIDAERNSCLNSKPAWITDEYCRTLVHKWRTEEDAFLVGADTVILDNPKLTARNWAGKNPLRLVIDPLLRAPKDSHIYNNEAKTFVFNNILNEQNNNIKYIKTDLINDSEENILNVLHNHKIQSIVIEGGAKTLQGFIHKGLWDEARVFIGKNKFCKGVKAPQFEFQYDRELNLGDNILRLYRNNQSKNKYE